MGETSNPVSFTPILRYLSFGSCIPIQGKGFGNQGAVGYSASAFKLSVHLAIPAQLAIVFLPTLSLPLI